MTYDFSTLITLNQGPDTLSPDTYTGPGGTLQGGTAYRLAGTNSDGQGWFNLTDYYPPGSELYFGYDGGAGGGGGGGNGYGGGLYEWSLQSYESWYQITGTYLTAWAHPYESAGAAGSQGFCYVNSSYYTYDTLVYYSPTASTYGSGYGLGATVSYNAINGGNGAAWLKVTNMISDNIFP
jgi:hypothetical protein